MQKTLFPLRKKKRAATVLTACYFGNGLFCGLRVKMASALHEQQMRTTGFVR